nr:hypothetical protein BaRGS_023108 [Batillaria attramentaria]
MLPASIVLGVAVLMFLIGLLGCIAVCKENKILLSTYFCLILLVFLGEVVAGVLGYAYRSEVEDTVSTGLMDAVNNYNDSVMAEQMDFVQQELKCCGVNNASDWLESTYWKEHHNTTVPLSCCRNYTGNPNTTVCNPVITGTDIYTKILGLITTCILICRTREVKYDRLENAQRDGLRV